MAASARAQRAARTRAIRDGRRDRPPRRTSAEVDDEREARGQPTLRASRGGLPSKGAARAAATHVDGISGAAAVSTCDPKTWGLLGPLTPPGVGTVVRLEREGEPARVGVVVEAAALGQDYYLVALR
jgi:hypothetical protein